MTLRGRRVWGNKILAHRPYPYFLPLPLLSPIPGCWPRGGLTSSWYRGGGTYITHRVFSLHSSMTLRGRRVWGNKILAHRPYPYFLPLPLLSPIPGCWPRGGLTSSWYRGGGTYITPRGDSIPLPRYHEPVKPPSTQSQSPFPNIITSNCRPRSDRGQRTHQGRGVGRGGV